MSGEITNYVIASEGRARQPRTLQGGLAWFAIASFLAMTKFNKLKANQNHEKNIYPIRLKPYHSSCD
jgi:hypothetical protein